MTTNTVRSTRTMTTLAVFALLAGLAGCGGSADAEEVSATLAIISTNIETAEGDTSFEPATEGQTLVVGDRVRTDPTGFAELTYHDGSWQRIEQSATLTIDELTDQDDTNVVRTSIDIGKTWNRVQELTEPDDAYELDTPVATAAVRGTAFATDCPTTTECTFSVVDGTVTISPTTGEPIILTAGQTITVTADQPPPAPTQPGVTTLSEDDFIARNLDLDQQDGGIPRPTQFNEQEANAFEGTYQLTTTVIEGNPSLPEGQVSQSEFTLTADCGDGVCVIEGDRGLGTAVRAGDGLRFQGTLSEPCPSDPSISATDTFDLVLNVDAGGLTGTLDQTTIDTGGCPNVEVDPVRYSWEAIR